MTKNTYHVAALFERARSRRKTEHWKGRARNMRMAMRAATTAIMTRYNVKRFRHERVTFTIEKVADA